MSYFNAVSLRLLVMLASIVAGIAYAFAFHRTRRRWLLNAGAIFIGLIFWMVGDFLIGSAP